MGHKIYATNADSADVDAQILYTLIQMERILEKEGPESNKLNRWIGFIQGFLFVEGFNTLDELKADLEN